MKQKLIKLANRRFSGIELFYMTLFLVGFPQVIVKIIELNFVYIPFWTSMMATFLASIGMMFIGHKYGKKKK